jgi:hypothetical protein
MATKEIDPTLDDAPRTSDEPAAAHEDEDDARPSSQPYQYQHLPSESSIRLLELLPSPEGQIYISLKIVNLDDDPIYDALSYSWASPITIREERIPPGEEGQKLKQSLLSMTPLPATSVPVIKNLDHNALIYLASNDYLPYMDRESGRDYYQAILCDGMKKFTTKTLFEALTQLRRIIMSKKDANEQGMAYLESLPVSRSKYLWVDAVCINQDDIDEKNVQVPLMSRIYASAQYVFAWVGELDTLGADGFQAIIDKGLGREHQNGPRARYTDDETFNKLDREVEKMQVEQRQLHALTALLSRQWFRRAWVSCY